MKRYFYIISSVAFLIFLGVGCTEKTSVTQVDQYIQEENQIAVSRPDNPQLGVNFIRFFFRDESNRTANKNSLPTDLFTDQPLYQPVNIFSDFENLGISAFRQFPKADLLWGTVEQKNNNWTFEGADAVLNGKAWGQPVVTIMNMQFASPTPPWANSPEEFTKQWNPEFEKYLNTVIERYADSVTYWELGNEMDHWIAYDPQGNTSDEKVNQAKKGLDAYPVDGFSPQEQGTFLAQVAKYIRQRDNDAVIVLPGMGGLSDYTLNTWLRGVIEGGGDDWFDVVNYHFYEEWQRYGEQRDKLQVLLEDLDIADKSVWLTETGTTSDQTLLDRTNYPNSEEEQASDVFRRFIPAYAKGDDLVMWHSYIGGATAKQNTWRGYGLITPDGARKLSYYALGLLADELLPFEQIETIAAEGPRGINVYRIIREDGKQRIVAWGLNEYTVENNFSEYASVISDQNGIFNWQPVAGAPIKLSQIPILIR